MVEKLSLNFWFIALIAVMIPTRAMIPKAIMATVRPVRSLLLLTERKASEKISRKFIGIKVGWFRVYSFRFIVYAKMRLVAKSSKLEIIPVQQQVGENAKQDHQHG